MNELFTCQTLIDEKFVKSYIKSQDKLFYIALIAVYVTCVPLIIFGILYYKAILITVIVCLIITIPSVIFKIKGSKKSFKTFEKYLGIQYDYTFYDEEFKVITKIGEEMIETIIKYDDVLHLMRDRGLLGILLSDKSILLLDEKKIVGYQNYLELLKRFK